MFSALKKMLLGCVLVTMVISQSGCFFLVGAAAGVGGYVWVKGALEQNLNATAEQVHAATVKALNKLKLTTVSDQSDRLKSKVVAEFADGQNVNIDIDALTELTTKIRIRVGVLGDKAKSELILSKIKRYL